VKVFSCFHVVVVAFFLIFDLVFFCFVESVLDVFGVVEGFVVVCIVL